MVKAHPWLGLGPEQKVTLAVADARFGRQTFEATIPAKGDGATFDWSLAAAQHLDLPRFADPRGSATRR